MIKYFEEPVTRKKTSNLLHFSLITLCGIVSMAYWINWMFEHPEKFHKTFKCAVQNAGIGEWKLDLSSGSFEHDVITKSLIGDVATFSEFINHIDHPDRDLVLGKFNPPGDVVVTCKVRGRELLISGVSSNGMITGIIQPVR
jgi:hypothetical protein